MCHKYANRMRNATLEWFANINQNTSFLEQNMQTNNR